MFDRLNELARRLAHVARMTRHYALAAEVYSYLPVEDAVGVKMLQAQLKVVQVLLKLRPSESQRLNEAVEALACELRVLGGLT